MIRNFAITLTSLSLVLFAAGCGTRVDAPGDTAAEIRTVQQDTEPGNILAEGRIKSAGE